MYNEIPQPLRFYSSLDYKAFNRRVMDGISEHSILVCSGVRLIPFILVREINHNDLTISIVNKKTSVSTDITSYFSGLLDTREDFTYEYIRYFANEDITTIANGIYDLRITDGVNSWYSEYFKVSPVTGTLEFEFYNTRDIGYSIYQNDFKYRFRIKAFISDGGEYESYKETIETLNKDIYNTFFRKDKIWQIQFFCNSYLYDTLHFMEMNDTVYLTDITSEKSEIQVSEITSEKIEKTDYLSVTLKFKIKENKYQVMPVDANASLKVHAVESGIYRGTKKIYRGGKKIIR